MSNVQRIDYWKRDRVVKVNRQEFPRLRVVFGATLGVMVSRKVDTEWFKSKIEELGKSMRTFASDLGKSREAQRPNTKGDPRYSKYDVSRLSRIINGEREPDLWEIVEIANLLGVRGREVAKRFGWDL